MSEETEYDPKLNKVIKRLGAGVKEEMDSLKEDGLRDIIVSSTNNISVAIVDLEANSKYQTLKESFKAAGEGLREVKKAQKARIDYALHLLGESGKL